MDIQRALLTKNMFSRPGKELLRAKGIVIHWVGNAGSSAMANRNYFESLKGQPSNDAGARYASAHFIVGLDGGIVQCVPAVEMAYHAGAKIYKPAALTAFGHYPNNCTVGIELCHPGADGQFTAKTLASAIRLSAALCLQLSLSPLTDIWTHHQITGKECPKWYVEHPGDFETFKTNVKALFDETRRGN
jgi:N-acetylmuramoyl-L-alanine amidase